MPRHGREKSRKPYEKLYGKYGAALTGEDDMMAERLEADCQGTVGRA